MVANHGALGLADEPFQDFLGFENRVRAAGKLRKEIGWLSDFPADIDRSDQVEAVFGQTFGWIVLEVLHALVEAMDHLNAPRPPEISSWLSALPGGLAESGNDDHFGLAHLKNKEQEADNEQQQNANSESECIAFHDRLFR